MDSFEHVTNSAYWHAIPEVLAHYPQLAEPPYRAVIEYRKPITLGESVTLRTETTDSQINVWSCVGEDVRATAMVCRLNP
nr:acyl-ACP thioesterase domain-containing protein [Aldersonia kunmingensis]